VFKASRWKAKKDEKKNGKFVTKLENDFNYYKEDGKLKETVSENDERHPRDIAFYRFIVVAFAD
jgi:hypothetical protein